MPEKKLKIAIPAEESQVQNYINALRELNAEPVLVETGCNPSGFDGLLLPGGGDINPIRYNEENTASWHPDDALDELQFTVIDKFVKAGKPILGICRGEQLINVYFGGTLIQHLPTASDHRGPQRGVDNVHAVNANGDSFLSRLYGERFFVNSAHHQAAGRLGEGLEAVLTADDGSIEALCHRTLPVIAVQWHPERMCFARARTDTVDGSHVIQHFLNMCD